jgi:hypothetical protein
MSHVPVPPLSTCGAIPTFLMREGGCQVISPTSGAPFCGLIARPEWVGRFRVPVQAPSAELCLMDIMTGFG